MESRPLEADGTDPIAVVGLGCRFPGTATSPEALWEMLINGESAWSEFPEDRMNMKAHYHPDPRRQGSTNVRGAHFLEQDMGVFDAPFFGISPDEAKSIDPQQRILLEVAMEALDNAGIDHKAIGGTETGVYIGSFVKDYEQIVLRDSDDQPQYSATGTASSILANRISYFLDVHGPSQTVDTGCSASLAAVHDACKSLILGETDIAIAGGCGLILAPNTIFSMQALGLLGPDGKCFTFDERANGYGRGEGVGVVILKRLEDAVRDNNCIRAVIRGSRGNHDGKTAGLTQPNSKAQMHNIEQLYMRAKLDLNRTGYVECHGTGTQAGDVREVEALKGVFCKDRTGEEALIVGSIKANVGHLEGAAGIAGFIKAILIAEKGIIPKQINFEIPNPALNSDDHKIKIPTTNIPFPRTGLRRISVNSFGFGGSNFHAVIDDAAHYLSERGIRAKHNTILADGTQDPMMPSLTSTEATRAVEAFRRELSAQARDDSLTRQNTKSHLFVFSAQNEDSLRGNLTSLLTYVSRSKCPDDEKYLENMAYTFGCLKTTLDWKTSFVATSMGSFKSNLAAALKGGFIPPLGQHTSPRVAFVFGGQGAQWYAMGRELMGFDIYAHSIAAASKFMSEKLGSEFNLVAELMKDEETSRINEPQIAQPATTVIQVALVDFLVRYCGLIPSSVVGHSSGEITAAYASRFITRETTWELAYHRGICAASMSRSSDKPSDSEGGMLAVGLSQAAVCVYVDELGPGRVTIACVNSPESTTLSGDKDAIMKVKNRLDLDGVFNRLLVVDVAYHSHHMARCAADYAKSIAHLKPAAPLHTALKHPDYKGKQLSLEYLEAEPALTRFQAPATTMMYSSVLERQVSWDELTPEYWANNLLLPVQFFGAVNAMIHSEEHLKPDIVLEIGPHATLRGTLRQIFDADKSLKRHPYYYSMLYRDTDATKTSLSAIGHLWTHGSPIEMRWVVMRNVRPDRPSRIVDLPTYTWNHDTPYWHEAPMSKENRLGASGKYDLIGRLSTDPANYMPTWRGYLRLGENPWMRHHQVQKITIYPASGIIAMVLEGAKQISSVPARGIEISDLKFVKAMIVPESFSGLEYILRMKRNDETENSTNQRTRHDTLSTCSSTSYEFSICSKPHGVDGELHSHGVVTFYFDGKASSDQNLPQKQAAKKDSFFLEYLGAQDDCHEMVLPRQLYETLEVTGMNYGPLFQNITSLRRDNKQCIFEVKIPDTKSSMPKEFEYPHIVHPATLDSIFHTSFSLRPEAMVPSSIGSIYVSLGHDLPRGVDRKFVGFAKAECQSRQKATLSIAVSDESWKTPTSEGINDASIIIKDMELVALSTGDKSASGGFIPNHQNLCSEIQWEPLDDFDMSQVHAHEQHDQSRSVFVLTPDEMGPELSDLSTQLCKRMGCETLTLAQLEMRKSSQVHCISLLEVAKNHHFFWNLSERNFASFKKLVESTEKLLWITRGATIDPVNPKSSLFQALARSIRSENSDKQLFAFDVERNLSAERTVGTIAELARLSFAQSGSAESAETKYAQKNGQIMVPRLVPLRSLNHLIMRGTATAEPSLRSLALHQGPSLKLNLRQIGDPDSLYWDHDESAYQELGANDVVIKVLAASLTLLDVDRLMNDSRDSAFGTDIHGIIEQIGASVRLLRVGERVLAMAQGSLRQRFRCHESLILNATNVIRPENTISLVNHLTPLAVAYYALCGLAKLDNKMTVLIHADADAFWIEALLMSYKIQATTFVAVKDEQQRISLTTDYGVLDANILNKNQGNFVDRIMDLTGGIGVNVIFDHTTDSNDLNVQCVANFGHIIRLARITKAERSLAAPVSKTFSTSIVSVQELIKERPMELGRCLNLAVAGPRERPVWDSMQLPKLHHRYDWSELPQAFRSLTSGKLDGWIRCEPSPDTEVPVMPEPERSVKSHLSPDFTYVIAGQGGLGRSIAEMLAANGVEYIAFLSRSGDATESSAKAIAHLRSRGVDARAFKADICDRRSLKRAILRLQVTMPPVRGLFQCAAVLRDAAFSEMTHEDWQTAVRPKTDGSWNLYEMFPKNMDFTIFLSSVSGVIGNRGQANYAAGNGFQDALSKYINDQGMMRAVSIDMGPVLGAGMLAEDPRMLDKLKASGFIGVRLQDFLRVVERAITGCILGDEQMPPQVVMGVGTGGLIRQNRPADPYWSRTALFTHLRKVDMPAGEEDSIMATTEPTAKVLLASARTKAEACQIIQDGLCTKIASFMNINGSDVDTRKSPSDYGVDSFLRPVLRDWLRRECDIEISVLEIEKEKSIACLARLAFERSELSSHL
uniref:Polyketide synthase n=1 Tax=Pestalotiopsis sp. TaxID=36460 RepID=A0A8U0ASD7_PESTX|nr:hypothetical protein [Pestalotiopsis sp.]